jgi:Ca2+-transporting ATPase
MAQMRGSAPFGEWYRLSAEEALARLGSSPAGLAQGEAARRLQHHGPNALPESSGTHPLVAFLHQFKSPLIYLLLLAATASAFLGQYKDAAVIAVVLAINAVIGFIQESRAERSVRALGKMLVPLARVRRDGSEADIESSRLVPGDVVLLASGSRVPADLRLLETVELRVDEAVLTGEAVPAGKGTGPLAEPDLVLGDQRNMAFTGTIVVGGRGVGVVTATGRESVLGRIASSVRETATAKAPLQERFDRFARVLGAGIVAVAAGVFGIGVALHNEAVEMFMVAMATAVAMIPEGLPVVVTITLAIGVSRMARRHAVVRRLPAVETLGSTTVICTDKTGTLTKNEMTVSRLVVGAGGHAWEVTGTGYAPRGELRPLGSDAAAPLGEGERELLRAGLLCNESALIRGEERWEAQGDPTEVALIVAAIKGGLDPAAERAAHPVASLLPFESERGWMATLHRRGEGYLLLVKGGPERVLDICGKVCTPDRDRILAEAEALAREGLRVLACASRTVPAGPPTPDLEAEARRGFVFAGLQAIIDPPREEAAAAIAGCRRAGIRTIMITGDHAVTAAAIGARLGIGAPGRPAISGSELESMEEAELERRIGGTDIFARVAPEHKLRIARLLVRRGEVVAMTGDGVNDAPALKAAHIGIAMGRAGTDVAREAASMVLTDDNFASIFAAVEEGRTVFENIRKVALYLLTGGLGLLLTILSSVFLGLPLPFTPTMILWVNFVTSGIQDMALAFEPAESGLLERPPRSPREGFMSGLMWRRMLLGGVLGSAGTLYAYHQALAAGADLAAARTAALTTIVFIQLFQLLNARSLTRSVLSVPPFSNPFLLASLAGAFVLQLGVIYVPALEWVLGTVPLPPATLGQAALVGAGVLAAVEIDKLLTRLVARTPDTAASPPPAP